MTKSRQISPYTHQLLSLRSLVKAGYPFSADDLPLEMWVDLGAVCDLIDLKTRIF